MIDHTSITVSNFQASKDFYSRALSPIGYSLIREVPASKTGHSDAAGFGVAPAADFWIGENNLSQILPSHVAFRVDNRSLVDAFHKAALAAGARDNGAPGLRPYYHPDYYGAFVLDPDGHNIEVVCRAPVHA
jgi:catechol 2,3-dioxygenase-like lactoylglutathione lyase family enzyme